MTKQVLKIIKDTFLKREPKLSSDLTPEQLCKTEAGKEFEIQSYAYADGDGDFDGHVKFALLNQNLQGFNTWYAYNKHIEIEFDGDVVYPQEEQASPLVLEIDQNTILKRQPIDAAKLAANEKVNISKGKTIDLHSYAYADAKGSFNGHIKFAIADPDDYINGFSNWYVPEQQAHVELNDELVYPLPKTPAQPASVPTPAPKPAAGTYTGKKITLPGGKGVVYTDQPVIAGGVFTWGQVTHGGVRLPQQVAHVDNMVKLATQLEKARDKIGKPFRITSWYRPEPWNSKVGGARQSQHLTGSGVDIVVAGYSGRQLGQALISWWPGGLGIYPGNRKHILHLDIGKKRKWGF
jgi:Peptidase M15